MDGSVELVTEFGRALHAGCASAMSRVEYVKHVDGADVAVIHLGADFLMRPAYVPDAWRHRFGLLDGDGAVRDGDVGPWTIAGPLCFAGDVIGRGVPLPPVRPGDRIVIHDVGAYTLSMWSRHCSRGAASRRRADGVGLAAPAGRRAARGRRGVLELRRRPSDRADLSFEHITRRLEARIRGRDDPLGQSAPRAEELVLIRVHLSSLSARM